jgi:hypothetical protein
MEALHPSLACESTAPLMLNEELKRATERNDKEDPK